MAQTPASRQSRIGLPATLVVASVTAMLVAFLAAGGHQQVSSTAAAPPTQYTYSVVHAYPHDANAFTQGLLYRDGYLFESTGLNGESTLRKVRLETGEVVQRVRVADQHFAEGLTDWRDELIQLTWQSHVGFVYDLSSFSQRRTFAYPTEGWGLAQDGRHLILSDGTDTLRFLDPETFQETGHIIVRDQGHPVADLNELEVVKGSIYANVWQTNRIAIIGPADGRVTGWIDLTGLRPHAAGSRPMDVLNGIAYDTARDRLFITGKFWPTLFEITIGPS
jgi:glutaminyl-peptide cyclotransferase